MQMAERSPIFSGKIDNQKIGYVEDSAAFNLLGNKRCNYSPNTGNLLDLESGKVIGYVSLAGYFVGGCGLMTNCSRNLMTIPTRR
jgi:hypothetical protein